MKVDKYIKKQLRYFYKVKQNRKDINNLIEGQKERVQDLIYEGFTELDANLKVIENLGDLSEFKSSLLPYDKVKKAYGNFIFSLFSYFIILAILIVLALYFKNYTIIFVIPMIATLFWPLSMWNNYYRKL